MLFTGMGDPRTGGRCPARERPVADDRAGGADRCLQPLVESKCIGIRGRRAQRSQIVIAHAACRRSGRRVHEAAPARGRSRNVCSRIKTAPQRELDDRDVGLGIGQLWRDKHAVVEAPLRFFSRWQPLVGVTTRSVGTGTLSRQGPEHVVNFE